MDIRPILSALHHQRTASALIVIEIALACAIVCNALFIMSERVDNLKQPSGIAEHELVQVRFNGGPNADAITREDLAALRAIPGVKNVAIINQVPFQNSGWNSNLALTPDQEQSALNASMYMAGKDTLRTLGLKLVAGRDFLPDEYKSYSDVEKNGISEMKGVLIITADAAKKLFPEDSAIGKTVYMANIPLHIVGVVERLARANRARVDRDCSMLLPLRLNYGNGGFYLLRTEPARRDEVLKAAVAALDKIASNRLVLDQRPYDAIRNKYFSADRDMIGLLLIVCFALMVVTALGIVGLASFWVQQRTKQIGIRRALGATRHQILRYFQTENFLLTSAGIVLGMLLAYALNLLLMSKYELPRLPLAYLPISAALLWLLGQLAVLAPARRAAAVPPAVATRSI
ncbi:MAG: ABC transporter permease [Pseudomonas sp.]